MPPHPLTNLKIQKCYQKEPKFNGVCASKDLGFKINDRAYITNLDAYEPIGTYQIVLYVNAENITYFHSFAVEYIPKEIRKFIRNKNTTTNIYRMQAYNLIIC